MERNVTGGHGLLKRETPAVVAAVLALSTLAGCGSSGSTGARAAASIAAPCTQVASILSDGPDPGADPVGYAQAQVLQLRRLGISEQPLHRAIDALASAYQSFSQTHGSAAAKAGVTKAVHEMNAICPGATE
jgi:hypothetical protein